MAAVVVTPTVVLKLVTGTKRLHLVSLALDTGDYAAGGFSLTPAMCGLLHIDSVMFEGAMLEVSATPTAQIPRWNSTTSKIEVYQAGANAGDPFPEKAAEAFGAGAAVRCLVLGH